MEYQHNSSSFPFAQWPNIGLKLGSQNSILKSLVSATSIDDQQPSYKYAVTSTIIQHTPTSETASAEDGLVSGKRGMHSATGAFWNNERDGMWSYKHEEETKGFDVIISIIWISNT